MRRAITGFSLYAAMTTATVGSISAPRTRLGATLASSAAQAGENTCVQASDASETQKTISRTTTAFDSTLDRMPGALEVKIAMSYEGVTARDDLRHGHPLGSHFFAGSRTWPGRPRRDHGAGNRRR